MKVPGRITVWGVVLCLVCGWTRGYPQARYKEISVHDGGSVSGVVKIIGALSPLDELTVTKDDVVCGRKKVTPRLVTDANECVQNAVVFLEGVDRGKKLDRKTMQIFTQAHCEYQPHVLVLQQGEQLEIVNSDPILHNVHAYGCDNGAGTIFNIAQPIRGQKTPLKSAYFPKTGILETACDAGHPWMSGYIFVVDHPYYAVTDKHGRFTLTDIQAGTYKLKMWHEGVSIVSTETENGKPKKYTFEQPYQLEKDVVVPENGRLEMNFEFALRKGLQTAR